jgi:hypothetical protein
MFHVTVTYRNEEGDIETTTFEREHYCSLRLYDAISNEYPHALDIEIVRSR